MSSGITLYDYCTANDRMDLLEQWHPTKNGDLTPQMVTAGSTKKVWWQCDKGHEYQASILNRKHGTKCPVCRGKLAIPGVNDLASACPELVSEWHPELNRDLTPEMVTAKSNKEVWWRCEHGHEWQAMIRSRADGYGRCPTCRELKRVKKPARIEYNKLATVNPTLAAQWNYEKNGDLTPEKVTAGSSKIVWWRCEHGHEWQARILNRSNGTGCPVCTNRGTYTGYNDLATVNPELAAQWHPVKNEGLTPQMVTVGSHKKVWWQCDKGHEWQAVVNERAAGTGCPVCANRIVVVGFNDLATTHPELAAQWHPTKNGDLKPEMVTVGSRKRVWWLCENGHEWETHLFNRASGVGCARCIKAKIRVGINDLGTTHPELAAQWHPTKNGNLTPQMVTAHKNQKVWWQCDKGHEWERLIRSRSAVKSTECPFCAKEQEK